MKCKQCTKTQLASERPKGDWHDQKKRAKNVALFIWCINQGRHERWKAHRCIKVGCTRGVHPAGEHVCAKTECARRKARGEHPKSDVINGQLRLTCVAVDEETLDAKMSLKGAHGEWSARGRCVDFKKKKELTMKGVNDVNRCSRRLGQGCDSHRGASTGNNRWAALPGVATLRLTRLEVAIDMLTNEAQKWLHDINKKELPQKRELKIISFKILSFNPTAVLPVGFKTQTANLGNNFGTPVSDVGANDCRYVCNGYWAVTLNVENVISNVKVTGTVNIICSHIDYLFLIIFQIYLRSLRKQGSDMKKTDAVHCIR